MARQFEELQDFCSKLRTIHGNDRRHGYGRKSWNVIACALVEILRECAGRISSPLWWEADRVIIVRYLETVASFLVDSAVR